MIILSKEKIEEHLFGTDSENKITDYQYEHFTRYWKSMDAFDEWKHNKENYTEKKAVMNWFMWYGEDTDLENIEWKPFELYTINNK